MPRSKAPARVTPKRAPARPRKTADDNRLVSVRGSLLDPTAWGRLSPNYVTPEVAVKVSSIFAVCRFIAQGVGVMPLHVMRTLPNGRKAAADDLPYAYTLRKRPNRWQSPFDFITLQAYWTALHGNGFARIISAPGNPIDQLIPMHPTRVTVEQLDDYSLRYKFLDSDGRYILLRQEEVLHWRWMSENGIWGMAPSEVCSVSIGLARQLDVAATAYWQNGARPDFVITTDDRLDGKAIERLRDEFREMYGGANRGAPAVLPKKMQLQAMQSNSMEQSQYQDLRNSILPDICRHWGVPSTLLGDAKMAKYSTVEQEHLSAQVWCMLPWQKRMEGPFDMALHQLTDDRSLYVKLDNRGLLRGDSAARGNMYRTLFAVGAITPNEIRDLEDFDLLDDPAADETFMQLGFSTLENAAMATKDGGGPSAQPTDGPSSDPPSQGEGVPQAGGFTEGQYVYWADGQGVIEHLMVDGTLGVPGTPFAIEATPESPAALIRIYESAGMPTELLVGKRTSDLSAEPI